LIAILNYGLGNLRSVQKAFEFVGAESKIVSDVRTLRAADKYVIPGVGAFGKGIANIRELGVLDCLSEEVLVKKKPVLGICLGLQLLAESSTEHGFFNGMGWLKGNVISLEGIAQGRLVPNVGWCTVESGNSLMFRDIPANADFYFVHSFFYKESNESEVSGRTFYGEKFACAIESENIWATQFHPEKSQKHGLQLLKNFSFLT
jgi:glutamine amidotransferase